VLFYTAGRFWIEALRIDTVNEVGGFRLNNYTSAIVFVGAALVLVWLVRNRPGRETEVERPAGPVALEGAEAEPEASQASGTTGVADATTGTTGTAARTPGTAGTGTEPSRVDP
jgi:hypothetical protein